MTKTNAQKTTAAKTTVRKESQLKTAFTTLKSELKTLSDTKKNALAKLAKKLKADARIVKAFKKDLGGKEYEVGGMMIDDIDKASRIVAELAKVKDIKEFGVVHVREDMAIGAVENCRAIAEGKENYETSANNRSDDMRGWRSPVMLRCDVCEVVKSVRKRKGEEVKDGK